MDGDPFETVAIAYSQPQATVLLSVFSFYGIPAFAQNIETLRANCPLTLALGGLPIRVARDCAEEARTILREAAERKETEAPTETLGERVAAASFIGVLGMLAVAPPPRLGVEIVGG